MLYFAYNLIMRILNLIVEERDKLKILRINMVRIRGRFYYEH